jgi:hypothetical protein
MARPSSIVTSRLFDRSFLLPTMTIGNLRREDDGKADGDWDPYGEVGD